MNVVGEYLKKIRDDRNLSQKAVQAKTGISDSVICNLESGETKKPDPYCLKKLAEEYQIDLIDLYLKAGYLERTDLLEYQRCFSGADSLSEEEHGAVQHMINVIVKKSERCSQ